MSNPNIGFKMVEVILSTYDLNNTLRYHKLDRALVNISKAINSLRGLRRAIRLEKNVVASIKGRKVKADETKPH